LVSITIGAFAIGTATGSFLTYGPGLPHDAGQDATSMAMASSGSVDGSGSVNGRTPDGSLDAEVIAGTGEGKMMLTARLQAEPDELVGRGNIDISGGKAALQGSMEQLELGRALAKRPDAPETTAIGAAAFDQAKASSQTDPTFPAALPEKSDIELPTPGLSNDTELAHIATIAKAALSPRPRETKAIKARKGDSLTTILKRAGVEGPQVHAALRSLRGVYDPRNLRAGQQLAVTAATREEQPAHLLSVAFDLDFDHQLLITRDADGSFSSKKVEHAKRRELVLREGEIKASLYLSARRQAIPNSVTGRLIRMFSWDIDFQRDIRRGDRFETLYEEVTLEKDQSQVKGELVYAGLTVRGKLIDAYLYSPDGGRPGYYDSDGRSLRKFLLRTPVDGARLSSHFGKRKHPILGYTRMHKGTDFAAPRGTPIFAGGSGKVKVAGRNGGYGNYLRIKHNDTFSTAYAHLNKFAKGIKPGVRVRQGQVVGYVGTTGRSTGPHLHYEVLKHGKQINPMKMKQPSATQLKGRDLKNFKKAVARIDTQRAKLAREQRLASSSSGGSKSGQ
jgi:murein DD-endopeptidase MepM/ murein hydrolase activator NlpD